MAERRTLLISQQLNSVESMQLLETGKHTKTVSTRGLTSKQSQCVCACVSVCVTLYIICVCVFVCVNVCSGLGATNFRQGKNGPTRFTVPSP